MDDTGKVDKKGSRRSKKWTGNREKKELESGRSPFRQPPSSINSQTKPPKDASFTVYSD